MGVQTEIDVVFCDKHGDIMAAFMDSWARGPRVGGDSPHGRDLILAAAWTAQEWGKRARVPVDEPGVQTFYRSVPIGVLDTPWLGRRARSYHELVNEAYPEAPTPKERPVHTGVQKKYLYAAQQFRDRFKFDGERDIDLARHLTFEEAKEEAAEGGEAASKADDPT